MKSGKLFSFVLYGAILGHWFLKVHRRLIAPDRARFVVVAHHCNRDEFVRVGACTTEAKADSAADHLDAESTTYIGLVYDLHNPDDKVEYSHLNFVSFVHADNIQAIEEAGALCECG